MRILVVLIVLMVSPLNAYERYDFPGTVFKDGNNLYAECAGYNLISCMNYIEAIHDSMSGGFAVWGYQACLPTNVTDIQIKDVVFQYLLMHSNLPNLGAAALIAKSFAETFPCPQ